MTFSEALEAMKQGYEVAREDSNWGLLKCDRHSLKLNEDGLIVDNKDFPIDMLPVCDIIATDWGIYNKPNPEPQFEIGELVMMSDSDAFVWEAKHFSHKVDAVEGGFRYRAIDGSIYRQCAKFDKDIVFTNKPVKK